MNVEKTLIRLTRTHICGPSKKVIQELVGIGVTFCARDSSTGPWALLCSLEVWILCSDQDEN
jgi:hypothetical protein